MSEIKTDIVIFGAGIAGLWLFHALKRQGYDVLLLDKGSIGGVQSVASQGIIHSGLKYCLAGKVNKLAQRISEMPQIWRDSLNGQGPVDLSAARVNAKSQNLLIPKGIMGDLVKLATKKSLGDSVHDIKRVDWPERIKSSGFSGSIIAMNELVLDIPSVVRALAEPYRNCIRKLPDEYADKPFQFLAAHNIKTQRVIFTAAQSNLEIANANNHSDGLETQHRPLLQVMMKNAPFELYAHLVSKSDKPVATLTTHKTVDGALVWYMGGSVAEKPKDYPPENAIAEAKDALMKYMPDIDLSAAEWAVLPIDRVEGKSKTDNWLPDTPTIHKTKDALYAWPTKLTFAPMLANMVERILEDESIVANSNPNNFDFLEGVIFTSAPWDSAQWKK